MAVPQLRDNAHRPKTRVRLDGRVDRAEQRQRRLGHGRLLRGRILQVTGIRNLFGFDYGTGFRIDDYLEKVAALHRVNRELEFSILDLKLG